MSRENQLGPIHLFLLLSSWSHFVCANPVPAPAATTLYYSLPSKGNPLGINWDPAPPPEFGPPLSAHASRNRALLPGQISAIVGAYIFTLFLVGVVLFFLSRKLRRELLENAETVYFPDIELLESKLKSDSTDPSPSSPQPLSARNFSWPSHADEKKSPTSYAFAVGPVVKSDSVGYALPPTVGSETTPYIYPSLKSKSALEINTNVVDHKVVEADRENLQRGLEDIYAHVMEQEELKAAGVDVKRIPPPRFPMGPIPGESPQRPAKFKPMPIDTSSPKSTKSRASSILSSIMSPKSKKGSKHSLRISSPIMTPLSASFSPGSGSDEEPLSPRFYAPPPAPPIPDNQSPHSPSSPHYNPNISPTRSIADTLSRPSLERPRGNQSTVSLSPLETRSLKLSLKDSHNPKSPDSAVTPKASNYPSNTPVSATQVSPVSAVSGASRALPFRQFEPESQFQSMNTTTATKTTVLERTNRSNGPQTAGLRTPWSGGAVPYSPYQPFTPMIPVTPRLVTKEDRKAMKKAMRAIPKTPTMEMVGGDDEIWDSGY